MRSGFVTAIVPPTKVDAAYIREHITHNPATPPARRAEVLDLIEQAAQARNHVEVIRLGKVLEGIERELTTVSV